MAQLIVASLGAMFLVMTAAAAFLLARHLYRRPRYEDDLSPVTRQHIEIFQGGQISETAVESAKTRFQDLLERGEVDAVEKSLRPGMGYIVKVQALAEIGTDDAGRILERQLQRRLSDDQLEQSWYWIDLASGLRSLNREQSLPHLLRCADAAGDIPLGHFFAAETVRFLGFAGYLQQTDTPLGRAALRVLQRALLGMRLGVQPNIFAEGRLGEAVENLWDHRESSVDPLVVRVFVEALRQLRRAPHAEYVLADEPSEQEGFQWQISRLAVLEPALSDYLQEAQRYLCEVLPQAKGDQQRDILLALIDLRAETAPAILSLLLREHFLHADLAVESLLWSKDPRVGLCLREWIIRQLPLERRAQKRRRAHPPRRLSVPAGFPYQAILRVLRHHPSQETEMLLLLAGRDWDPIFRAAALSSFGWWEPLRREPVLEILQEGRYDANSEVRQAARAALARLGERQALQWFRQALTGDDIGRVHEAIQLIPAEGLTLLWPDLDRLADADDIDVAHHAREAIERLTEDWEARTRN